MKKMLLFCLSACVAVVLANAPTEAAPRPYVMDRSHSAVLFEVSHGGFSGTYGRFREFSADILFDPDAIQNSRVTFRIKADSVYTDWEARDDHIRSDDFLDARDHPEIVFVSTNIEPLGEGKALLTGDLTLRGETSEQTFDVTLLKTGEFRGKQVVGLLAVGTIDRTLFGMDYAAPFVGTEMPVTIAVEMSPR